MSSVGLIGGELPLGVAWDSAGARDLTFRYQTPDGMLRNGSVFFGDKATIATENADFDSDGDVDGGGFLAWQLGLGLTGQPNRSTGDANGDGNVTGADLAIWRSQFGQPAPIGTAAAAVPEPASALLALGTWAFVIRKRKA